MLLDWTMMLPQLACNMAIALDEYNVFTLFYTPT